MDKQIIHGVDVSKCEFALQTIDTERIKCCCIKGLTKMSCNQPESIRRDWCDQNPDCLYKQYSRKEQECEEWKNKYYRSTTEVKSDLIKQFQKYRSALEEIRGEVEQDTTCESRECGCDDYAECLNCIKETILNKISEVEDDK